MDFREHQDKAKRISFRIWLAYALLIIVSSSLASTVIYSGMFVMIDKSLETPFALTVQALKSIPSNLSAFFLVALFFSLVIIASTITGFFRSSNGHTVALSLGGVNLNHAEDLSEKETVALNIMQEISLAANITTPDLYVIEDSAINAFTAGSKEHVVAITTQALEVFSRDELSGVIAHEIGHIVNKDVALNIQIASLVFGFMAIFLFARLAFYHGVGGRNNRNNVVILIMAGLLFLIGVFTVFAGKILQSMMSKQREYLADATAVQFTRYPDGLKSALSTISGYSTKLETPKLSSYSHAFIFGSSKLFSTHPPIDERIKRLENKSNSTQG